MAASERWDAFLAQIRERHQSVRAEAARDAATYITSATGMDHTALSNAWSAVDNRLQELELKIGDTWREKVDQAFCDENADDHTRDAAFEKGDDQRFSLETTRLELEQKIFADLARHLFAQAMASRRDRFCSECGTALVLPICARAVTIACAKCTTPTMFEPGDLLRAAAAVGAHALSQERVFPEWLAMRTADRRLRAERSPHTLERLLDYERTQIAYWRAYVAARGQIEPEMARDPALEVRSRMDQWYRLSAEHEVAWVRAGRPRAV